MLWNVHVHQMQRANVSTDVFVCYCFPKAISWPLLETMVDMFNRLVIRWSRELPRTFLVSNQMLLVEGQLYTKHPSLIPPPPNRVCTEQPGWWRQQWQQQKPRQWRRQRRRRQRWQRRRRGQRSVEFIFCPSHEGSEWLTIAAFSFPYKRQTEATALTELWPTKSQPTSCI